MSGTPAPGDSGSSTEPAADDTQTPELADPGSKTQPAEGGREEATDGASGEADGPEVPRADDATT